MNYVIIGNGAAGIAASEKLKKLNKSASVTILTAENYSAYSKCLLADYLSGNISDERMLYRDKDFYRRKGIEINYNLKVVDIDFKSKIITTKPSSSFNENGELFSYDKLLIATGSTPIVPNIKGLDKTKVYFLNTFDDAKRILIDSKKARKVVIIGAGYVGLEAAFSLYKNGREVTIIERTPRILENQLDNNASMIIQNGLLEEGIRLMTGCTVSEVGRPLYSSFIRLIKGTTNDEVHLDDGRKLKADMIIVTVGSRPTLDFIKDTDLETNKGILVDSYLETSIRDVYAAGDVVESRDAVTGENSLSPIWPNAVIQGEYAAYNMAGIKKEFSELISSQNSSEFREIPMISMGITDSKGPGFEEYIDYRPIERIYKKVIIKDDVIKGMIFLGDIKTAGVIGALMKNKANVGKVKNNLLNSNFGYSEVASLI